MISVLYHKKGNNHKIIHSSAKVIVIDSDIDELIKCMHQRIMKKIKKYACENWIVLDIIIKHSIKIFDCAWINVDNK